MRFFSRADIVVDSRAVAQTFLGDFSVRNYRGVIDSIGILPDENAMAFEESLQQRRIRTGQISDGIDIDFSQFPRGGPPYHEE